MPGAGLFVYVDIVYNAFEHHVFNRTDTAPDVRWYAPYAMLVALEGGEVPPFGHRQNLLHFPRSGNRIEIFSDAF
jgi:hypothetical protein